MDFGGFTFCCGGNIDGPAVCVLNRVNVIHVGLKGRGNPALTVIMSTIVLLRFTASFVLVRYPRYGCVSV